MAVQLAGRRAARLFFAVEAATVGDELACGVLGHGVVAGAGGGAGVSSGCLGQPPRFGVRFRRSDGRIRVDLRRAAPGRALGGGGSGSCPRCRGSAGSARLRRPGPWACARASRVGLGGAACCGCGAGQCPCRHRAVAGALSSSSASPFPPRPWRGGGGASRGHWVWRPDGQIRCPQGRGRRPRWGMRLSVAGRGRQRRRRVLVPATVAGDGFGVRQGDARGRVSQFLHVARSEGVTADAAVQLL